MATPLDTPGLTVTAEGEVRIVAVTGELDISTAPALCLQLQLAAAAAEPPRMVIDLRRVDVADSTGLRALICAAQEMRALSGAVAVVAMQGTQVDGLLTLAGAREFLAVTRRVQDAVALV